MTCAGPRCTPARCGDRVATEDGGWACADLIDRGWFSDLKPRRRLAQRVGRRPTATSGVRREMAGAASKEG